MHDPSLRYQTPHGIFVPMIKCYCCHYQALGLYLSTHDRPRYSGRSWDTFKGRSSHPMSNTPTFLTFPILLFLSAPPKLACKAATCSSSPTSLWGRAEGTLCHTTSLTLGYHRTPPCLQSVQSRLHRAKFLIFPYLSWDWHRRRRHSKDKELGKTLRQNGWRSCPGLRFLQPDHIHIHSKQHSSYTCLLHVTQHVWNPWQLNTTGVWWLVTISDLVCASPLLMSMSHLPHSEASLSGLW